MALGVLCLVDLDIVVVSYRTPQLLRQCLASVFASEAGLTCQVCVVDNCSQDESCAMVEAEYPQVKLVTSHVNGGYPYANNLGLRAFGFGRAADDGVAAVAANEVEDGFRRSSLP